MIKKSSVHLVAKVPNHVHIEAVDCLPSHCILSLSKARFDRLSAHSSEERARYLSRQGYRRTIAARPGGASVITQHRDQFGLVLAGVTRQA
jgi:hypothetical protein